MPDTNPTDLIAASRAAREGTTPGPHDASEFFVDESCWFSSDANATFFAWAAGDSDDPEQATYGIPALEGALEDAVATIRTLLNEAVIEDHNGWFRCGWCHGIWEPASVAPHLPNCPIPAIREKYEVKTHD